MAENNANANTNSNGEDEGGIGIGFALLMFTVFVAFVMLIIYVVLKVTGGRGPDFSQYSQYARMTQAQRDAAERQAAGDFYAWNSSQNISLTGASAPGSGSSNIPINVPHLLQNLATAIALDPGVIGAELKFIKNRFLSSKLLVSRTATLCARLEVKLGEKLATRLGIKAAAKTLTIAATKFSTALATRAITAASTGPAAPIVFLAEMAFQATLGLLDQFGVGGYTELTPTKVYEGMRDELDRFLKEEVEKEGGDWPRVVGPLDKLSQTVFEEKISNAYDYILDNLEHPVTKLFVTLQAANRKSLGRALTASEEETLWNTQGLGQALKDAVMLKLANDHGGKVVRAPSGNVYCSYTTQAATDSSYHWPLTSENENDLYCEWNSTTQVAELRQSYMRTFSEQLGNGCTYDRVRRIPNITEGFCRTNGLDYDSSKRECKYAEGQEIAEMIFGKTFVRGLTQVFDPKQYKSCPEMDFCKGQNCIDDGYFCRISRLAYMRNPKGPKGCKPGFELTSPGSGFCKNECPTDSNGKWKMYGGLCYHPKVDTNALSKIPSLKACSEFGSNLRDDGTSCWSEVHWDNCSWRGLFNECVGGLEGGGMVANVTQREGCPDGYTHIPGSCRAVSRPLNTQTFSVLDPNYGGCPTGQEAEGLFCYDPCPKDWTKTQGGLWCSPNAGAKVSIKAKERKFAYSTPDFQNSPVGKRIQQIKEAGQSGDVGGLAAGLACLSLSTSPIVNGLGLQDFANMIPDPKTGQGVEQT
jgi:hypothetical protein